MILRNRITAPLFLLLLSACGFIKPVQEPSLLTAPASFAGTKDTLSSATISWREFFGDKTLVQYIDTALRHNTDLLSATQEVEEAKANLRLHKGSLFPGISAYAGAGVVKYSHYTSDYAGNSTTEITPGKIVPNPLPDYSLGLQASWEADVTGKLRNMKKAAEARYLESEEGRNWAVTNLVNDVASALL
jgi:outer membrane protein TolC